MTESDCKQCARCREVKPRAEFPQSKQRRDKLYPYCRACSLAIGSEYRAKNRERLREYQQSWVLENADEQKAKQKAWREANSERIRETQRAYYVANRDEIKAKVTARYRADPAKATHHYKAWCAAHPEKIREHKKKSRLKTPERAREGVRRRYARKRKATIVKFSLAQLAQRMAYWGNRCWLCGGPEETVDHVKPLSVGGAHMLCNLRPACLSCNSKKWATWPFDTSRRKPMSNPLAPKSTGEFPTPTEPETILQPRAVDENGHLLADVEFPMPGVETVYYNDEVRKAAEADAKTVAKADTKVVDKGSASTKSVK